MNIRCLLLALAIALAIPFAIPMANAAQSASTTTARPASTPAKATESIKRPLLWKVSDADNSVYLLGSFHLLKPDDYPLPLEVDRAFDDAESLLFEVDPIEMNAPATMAMLSCRRSTRSATCWQSIFPRYLARRMWTNFRTVRYFSSA